jgi:hypothetical protein
MPQFSFVPPPSCLKYQAQRFGTPPRWGPPSGSFAVQGRDRNSRAHQGRAERSALRSVRRPVPEGGPHLGGVRATDALLTSYRAAPAIRGK